MTDLIDVEVKIYWHEGKNMALETIACCNCHIKGAKYPVSVILDPEEQLI